MAQQKFILQLQNVVKRFGGITASNNITINVPEGSIYGIIGPNGAGKTTLFNMITGVYDCTEGTVLFEGEKINGLPTHEIAVRGIARTFQNIRLFGDLTVYDNLMTACQKISPTASSTGFCVRRSAKPRSGRAGHSATSCSRRLGCRTRGIRRPTTCPTGMQRRLEIARALATCPKVILLDEPAAGMNEEESAKLSEFIREIRDKKDVTVVIIDHHMDVIMAICDQIFRAQLRHPLSGGETGGDTE